MLPMLPEPVNTGKPLNALLLGSTPIRGNTGVVVVGTPLTCKLLNPPPVIGVEEHYPVALDGGPVFLDTASRTILSIDDDIAPRLAETALLIVVLL